MKLKAIATYRLDHKTKKVDWEFKPCENPMLPPFTTARVSIDEKVMFSTVLPKTMQMIDLNVTFECLKCNFKTDSLEDMENHSKIHVKPRRV